MRSGSVLGGLGVAQVGFFVGSPAATGFGARGTMFYVLNFCAGVSSWGHLCARVAMLSVFAFAACASLKILISGRQRGCVGLRFGRGLA